MAKTETETEISTVEDASAGGEFPCGLPDESLAVAAARAIRLVLSDGETACEALRLAVPKIFSDTSSVSGAVPPILRARGVL